MSSELQLDLSVTSQTIYFLLRTSTGQVWNGAAFEVYNSGHYATYPLAATEQGASGFYAAAFPAAVTTTGVYGVVAKQQAGGGPAETDTSVGWGNQYWDGTNLITNFLPTNLSVLGVTAGGRVSLNSGWVKNAAVPDFQFLMVLTDGTTPATGKVVTGTRNIDNAGFAACANAVTEVANGWYNINLANTDLNGGVIGFRFTAAGCLDRDITIRTDP